MTPRQNPAVVTREIAGETLLVPVRGRLAQLQQLFVLDPVAHFIWQQLDGSRDVAAVHSAVLEHFEVEADVAQRDLLSLLDEFAEAGLLAQPETTDAR